MIRMRLRMPGYEPVTVLVGLLAGSVALLGSLVSRSNTVSGFRQSWINDQRADIATICSCATIISSNITDDVVEYFQDFSASYSRMMLRSNPKKELEWLTVLTDVDNLHQELWNRKGTQHDVTEQLRIIELASRWPLKDNWSKTKHGEREYWIAALVAGLAIVACLIVAVYGTSSRTEPRPSVTNIVVGK
jgi:hypothetical protein